MNSLRDGILELLGCGPRGAERIVRALMARGTWLGSYAHGLDAVTAELVALQAVGKVSVDTYRLHSSDDDNTPTLPPEG